MAIAARIPTLFLALAVLALGPACKGDGNALSPSQSSKLASPGNTSNNAGTPLIPAPAPPGGAPTTGGTVKPAAPTNLSPTAGNAQITLTWTASTGATGYTVYYDLKTITAKSGIFTKTGISDNFAVITNLTNGQAYFFRVAASNTAGESDLSVEVGASPVAPSKAPDAPKGLNATAGDKEVTLSWNVVAGADEYIVYYSNQKNVTPTIPNRLSGTTTGLFTKISSLTNGTTYYFVVTAKNSAGESDLPVEVFAKPTPPPPGNLVVTNHVGGIIQVLVDGAAVGTVAERATKVFPITSGGTHSYSAKLDATDFASAQADFTNRDIPVAYGTKSIVSTTGGSLVNETLTVTAWLKYDRIALPGAVAFLGQDGDGAGAQKQDTAVDGRAAFTGLNGAQTLTVSGSNKSGSYITSYTVAGANARQISVPMDIRSRGEATLSGTLSNIGSGRSPYLSHTYGSPNHAASYTSTFLAGKVWSFSAMSYQSTSATSAEMVDVLTRTGQAALSSGQTQTLNLSFPSPNANALPRLQGGSVTLSDPYTKLANTEVLAQMTMPEEREGIVTGFFVSGATNYPRSFSLRFLPIAGAEEALVLRGSEKPTTGIYAGQQFQTIQIFGGSISSLPSNVYLASPPTVVAPTQSSNLQGAPIQVRWSPPSGASVDYVILNFSQDAGGVERRWRVLLPGTATTFTLPKMPAAQAARNFAVGQPVTLTITLSAVPGAFDFHDYDFENPPGGSYSQATTKITFTP